MNERKNIQVLKPKYRVQECLDEIRDCMEIGWTGMGNKTTEFEEAWEEYTGLPHAHMVNSATAGLHLAVNILKQAYGWKDGDEIISTGLTFVSTNHAIMYENMVPVFADVNKLDLCLDPASIEKKITPRTRAVMYVGLGGRVGHLDEVRDLCKKHGLKLILDAAHMAGTRYNHQHVGHNADVTVFSFQAVKNLPTADAGMICFADAEFDAKARKMSWLGIDKDTASRSSSKGTYKWRYDVPHLGFKYHGNSVMGAIGLVQLRYIDGDNQHRRMIADVYNHYFENHSKIWCPQDVNGAQSSCHIYQVALNNRDEVLSGLNNLGIYPGVHYVDNSHYHMYRQYNPDTDTFSREISERLLSLPCHLEMELDDAHRVAESLLEVVSELS
jgi:dTDP-4-amino-4,6-dideoxygalactose transaminase